MGYHELDYSARIRHPIIVVIGAVLLLIILWCRSKNLGKESLQVDRRMVSSNTTQLALPRVLLSASQQPYHYIRRILHKMTL